MKTAIFKKKSKIVLFLFPFFIFLAITIIKRKSHTSNYHFEDKIKKIKRERTQEMQIKEVKPKIKKNRFNFQKLNPVVLWGAIFALMAVTTLKLSPLVYGNDYQSGANVTFSVPSGWSTGTINVGVKMDTYNCAVNNVTSYINGQNPTDITQNLFVPVSQNCTVKVDVQTTDNNTKEQKTQSFTKNITSIDNQPPAVQAAFDSGNNLSINATDSGSQVSKIFINGVVYSEINKDNCNLQIGNDMFKDSKIVNVSAVDNAGNLSTAVTLDNPIFNANTSTPTPALSTPTVSPVPLETPAANNAAVAMEQTPVPTQKATSAPKPTAKATPKSAPKATPAPKPKSIEDPAQDNTMAANNTSYANDLNAQATVQPSTVPQQSQSGTAQQLDSYGMPIATPNYTYEGTSKATLLGTSGAAAQPQPIAQTQSQTATQTNSSGTNSNFTGNGSTLEDTTKTAQQREFIPFQTSDGSVFYIIIDREQTGNNAYVLKQVDNNDVAAIASGNKQAENSSTGTATGTGATIGQTGIPGASGSTTTPEENLPSNLFGTQQVANPQANAAVAQPQNPANSPQPATSDEPTAPKSSNPGGLLMFLIIIILLVLAGYYYFKIYRPKQRKASGGGSRKGRDFDNAEDFDDMEFENVPQNEYNRLSPEDLEDLDNNLDGEEYPQNAESEIFDEVETVESEARE